MLRRSLLLALVASLLAPSAALALTQAELDAQYKAGTIPFRDIPADSVFFPFVSKLKELKLTQGTGDGFYEPTRCVSKAEAVKFSLDTAGVPAVEATSTPFTDITVAWQRNYVETARVKGFLPQTDVRFHPNDCASRIFTLMTMLRAAKVATPFTATTVFTDVTVPEQMAAVEVARSKNIVSGRSPTLFAPYDATLRQEMAKILVNTYTTVLHPAPAVDRRPDFETAVRIQTIVDNITTILTANGIAPTGTVAITRFSFVSIQYVYVDYTDGATKKRILLDVTKPDANFRIAVLATFAPDANGAMKLVTGTDAQKDKPVTVFAKEGTLWLKQAELSASEQLFMNSAGYSIRIPKTWFYWNRGAVSPLTNESLFATAPVTELNWIFAVRVHSQAYATVIAADSGKTAEEVIRTGVLRSYADGTLRVFLPFATGKTVSFHARSGVTKAQLTTVVNSFSAA